MILQQADICCAVPQRTGVLQADINIQCTSFLRERCRVRQPHPAVPPIRTYLKIMGISSTSVRPAEIEAVSLRDCCTPISTGKLVRNTRSSSVWSWTSLISFWLSRIRRHYDSGGLSVNFAACLCYSSFHVLWVHDPFFTAAQLKHKLTINHTYQEEHRRPTSTTNTRLWEKWMPRNNAILNIWIWNKDWKPILLKLLWAVWQYWT